MDPTNLPEKSQLGKFMQPKKLIHWDKDGIPRPHTAWLLPKNRIDDVLLAAMALPYDGSPDPTGEIYLEPEYTGLTNIEVACIKQAKKAAAGDLESLRFTVERLLGKPKQSVEQTSVTMSLKEYLETLDLGDVVQSAKQAENVSIVDAVSEEIKMPDIIRDEYDV